MPCYNSEAYLTDALESVVNQTYENWELIIINDGSVDNTLKIVNSYAEKDERIKVFSKENGGYATAVNMGLDHVEGDYFLFLGSDDYLAADLFEKLYNEIEKINILPDMIAFRTRKVENGVVGQIEKRTRFENVLLCNRNLKEFTESAPQHASIFVVRDTSRCYKRELLGETRYFGTTGMDADGIFSMLIAHKAHSFFNVPVDGYFWRIRGDSVSATKSLRKTIDRIDNWYRFFNIIIDFDANEITSAEQEYLKSYSSFIMELASVPGNVIKYRDFIMKNAVFSKDVSKIMNVDLSTELDYIAKVPLLYSVYRWSRRFIKKKWSNFKEIIQNR